MAPNFNSLHVSYVQSTLSFLLYLVNYSPLKTQYGCHDLCKNVSAFLLSLRELAFVLSLHRCIPLLLELPVLLWFFSPDSVLVILASKDVDNVWQVAGSHKWFLNKWLIEMRDEISKDNKPGESNTQLACEILLKMWWKIQHRDKLKRSALF